MCAKRAKKSFTSGDPAVAPQRAIKGGLFPNNHPLVKAHPDMFEDVQEYVDRSFPDLVERKIEQATAVPGEKRSVGRPPKRVVKEDDE